MDDDFGPLRKGLLEFVILTVVARARVYAADILATLASTPFATQEGTLYPLLSKLRREELLDYEWVESEAGPPRKYYRLTPAGAARLDALRTYWGKLNDAIEKLGS